MSRGKSKLFVLAGLVGLAALGTMTAPKLRAAVKAALVEVVVPSQPLFVGCTGLQPDSPACAVGPATGTFAVSSITVENFNTGTVLANIFQATTAQGGCAGGVVAGNVNISL
jgi:hypothetical protein